MIISLQSTSLAIADRFSFYLNDLVSYPLAKTGLIYEYVGTGPSPQAGVIVTGTSSGIGREVALSLAREGYTVFGTVRKEEDGEDLKKELGGAGRFIPILVDLTDMERLNSAVEEILEEAQKLGVFIVALVNNAGYAIFRPLEITTASEMSKIMSTNFLGAAELTRLLVPTLRQTKGRVLNIGSAVYYTGAPWYGAYGATKAAVRYWSDTLRYELAASGISVCIIEPGLINTVGIVKAANSFDDYVKEGHENAGVYSSKAIQGIINVMQWGIGPEHVVRSVNHALLSPYPKSVYLVGWDARILALMHSITPRFVTDFLMTTVFSPDPAWARLIGDKSQ